MRAMVVAAAVAAAVASVACSGAELRQVRRTLDQAAVALVAVDEAVAGSYRGESCPWTDDRELEQCLARLGELALALDGLRTGLIVASAELERGRDGQPALAAFRLCAAGHGARAALLAWGIPIPRELTRWLGEDCSGETIAAETTAWSAEGDGDAPTAIAVPDT